MIDLQLLGNGLGEEACKGAWGGTEKGKHSTSGILIKGGGGGEVKRVGPVNRVGGELWKEVAKVT